MENYENKIMELLAGETPKEKYETLLQLIEYYINTKKKDVAKSDKKFIEKIQVGEIPQGDFRQCF